LNGFLVSNTETVVFQGKYKLKRNTCAMFTMVKGLTLLLIGTSTFVYGFTASMCGGGYGNPAYQQGDMASLMSSAQACQYNSAPYFFPGAEGGQPPMNQQPMSGGSCQLGGSCSANGYGSQPGGGLPMQQPQAEECDVMTVVECGNKSKGNNQRNFGWNQSQPPRYSQQPPMAQNYGGSPHTFACDCSVPQQSYGQQYTPGGSNGGMGQGCECPRQGYYPSNMSSSMLTGQTTSMCNNSQGTGSGFGNYLVSASVSLGSNLTECSSQRVAPPTAIFGVTELPIAPGFTASPSSCTPTGTNPCGITQVN